MILPNNGKVVIIDDKWDEVQELISAFSSEKVPLVFYQKEDGSDLPTEPIENVRLIVLDLMLVTDDENTPDASVIATVAARLKRVLSENNGPYVLVYWSTKEDKYRKLLEDAFNDRLSAYKPFTMISLTKPNTLENIKKELESKFEEFKSLNALLLWESLVNKSGGDIINDFTSFHEINGEWNENILGTIYKLALAMVGKENIAPLTNQEKIDFAFNNLNLLLIDTLENNIRKYSEVNIGDINPKTLQPETLSKINTKIHLLDESTGIDILQSGNLYIMPDNNEHDINKIITDSAQSASKATEVINSNPRLIELDVTPVCDYAQNKVQYVRLLPGILVKAEFVKHFKNADYNYNICPPLMIEGVNSYILFDFRFLKSIKKNDLLERTNKPKYKIRNQLLVDIQSGLSKHINRPGIISVS